MENLNLYFDGKYTRYCFESFVKFLFQFRRHTFKYDIGITRLTNLTTSHILTSKGQLEEY